MPAPFDSKLVAELLGMPPIAFTDYKTKKVRFEGVANLARAMLYELNKKAPADTCVVARNVGFRKKEGGTPLVIPGYVPVVDVVARAAAGEPPEAIAKSIGGRAPDVKNVLAFAAKHLRKAGKVAASAKTAAAAEARKPAKKPPAAKPKKPDPKVTRASARLPSASEQVDAVVARASGEKRKRKPLAAALVAKLRLGGARVPKSLARWLAFDTALAPPHRSGELVATPLAQIAKKLAPHLAGLGLDYDRLPGACYLLQLGDEQASFLYAGVPDADGELPVLVLDAREQDVALAAPGFDVWLATVHDVVPSEAIGELPEAYGKLMAEHARLSLGGKRSVAL